MLFFVQPLSRNSFNSCYKLPSIVTFTFIQVFGQNVVVLTERRQICHVAWYSVKICHVRCSISSLVCDCVTGKSYMIDEWDMFFSAVRSNMLGTQFTVFDDGASPKGRNVTENKLRHEMVAIAYVSRSISTSSDLSLRPMSDMQQCCTTLSHNFVAQQSCLSDITRCPTFDESSNEVAR